MTTQEWSRDFEDIWAQSDELARLGTLNERLPYLSESEIEEALHRSGQIEDPYVRLEAFKSLVPLLREASLRAAVEIARELPDPALLAVVAGAMPPDERSELVREVWSHIRDSNDEVDRWRALEPLLPLLPASLKGPARRLIQGFSDPFQKPEALARVAEFLDERQKADALLEALEAARDISVARIRAYLLCLIAKQLPEPTRQEVVREALKATVEVEVGDRFRADSFIDLAELVSEDERENLYRDALESMRAVKEDRSEVLIRLAPRIPRRLWPDLEAITQEIEDPTERTGALLRLRALSDQEDGGLESVQQVREEGAKESPVLKSEPPPDPPKSPPDPEPEPPPEPPKPSPDPEPAPPPPRDLDVAVSIHDDAPARLDELNRIPFANVLATTMQEVWEGRSKEAAAARHETPGDAFIIHIHGPWGSGKSSVLNFLRRSLRKGVTLPGGDRPNEPWIVIWFNAWRHQRVSPPWWALIEAIYRQGRGQIAKKDRLALFFRRQLWLFRTGMAPYIFAFAALLLLASLGAGLLDSSGGGAPVTDQHSYRTGGGSADRAAQEGGLTAFLSGLNLQSLDAWLGTFAGLFALWGVLQGGLRALMFGSASTAARFMELSRDPMRPIVKHFHHLIAAFRQPVAIFIDDLDRCDKDYVLELLRGLQTLFHEANVTYVIAADREWLRASYESHYEDFSDNVREAGRPLGFLFLDKLFQVSVCIPRLSPARQKEYLETLIRRGDGQDQETAEREAEAEAERALGEDHSHNRMLERIDRETDRRRKRALRAAVARRLVTAKASTSTEHVLQEFSPMLEANPRAMKRLVNAYGFNKAVSLLAGQDLDVGPLARWTIIEMRWPLLARYLERNAEQADEIGVKEAPANLKGDLAALYQDDEILRVIRGPTQGQAASLSASRLKEILGAE